MSVISKEDIAEFKITMHDTQGVEIAHSFNNLTEVVDSLLFIETLSGLDVAVELSAFTELKHYVDFHVVFKDSLEFQDIFMFESLVDLRGKVSSL